MTRTEKDHRSEKMNNKWLYISYTRTRSLQSKSCYRLGKKKNLFIPDARCWKCQKLTDVQKAMTSHELEIHQVLLHTKALLGKKVSIGLDESFS